MSCLHDVKYERHGAYLQDESIQFDFSSITETSKLALISPGRKEGVVNLPSNLFRYVQHQRVWFLIETILV